MCRSVARMHNQMNRVGDLLPILSDILQDNALIIGALALSALACCGLAMYLATRSVQISGASSPGPAPGEQQCVQISTSLFTDLHSQVPILHPVQLLVTTGFTERMVKEHHPTIAAQIMSHSGIRVVTVFLCDSLSVD